MTSSPIDPAIASAFEEETPFHTPNVLLNTPRLPELCLSPDGADTDMESSQELYESQTLDEPTDLLFYDALDSLLSPLNELPFDSVKPRHLDSDTNSLYSMSNSSIDSYIYVSSYPITAETSPVHAAQALPDAPNALERMLSPFRSKLNLSAASPGPSHLSPATSSSARSLWAFPQSPDSPTHASDPPGAD